MIKPKFFVLIFFTAFLLFRQATPVFSDTTEDKFIILLKQERQWRKNNNLPYIPFPYDAYLAEYPGKVKKADDIIKQYENFLKKHPYHVNASRQLAVIFKDLHQIELAKKQWLKTASISKDDDIALNECGIFFSDNYFKPLTAASMFEKAIEINPNIAVYYSNLALVYFTGRHKICKKNGWTLPKIFSKILDLYDKARKLDTRNYLHARDYAQNYIMASQFNVKANHRDELEAWKYCFNTQTTNKQLSYIYLQLARVYRNLNDKTNEKRCLYKSLIYNKNNKIAVNMLKNL